jgi:hypothetical protein
MQIAVVIIILLFLYVFFKTEKMPEKILSHWHHRFETIPFSSQEFYQGLKEALAAKDIRHVAIWGISYTQGGLLSPRRDYLRIHYKELIYDVCAAPFGKQYFVSSWLGEAADPTQNFFTNIPLIGKFFSKGKKTFFELDTEIMFKETVSACVQETIEQLTQTKGMRQLANADWKEYNHAYIN